MLVESDDLSEVLLEASVTEGHSSCQRLPIERQVLQILESYGCISYITKKYSRVTASFNIYKDECGFYFFIPGSKKNLLKEMVDRCLQVVQSVTITLTECAQNS